MALTVSACVAGISVDVDARAEDASSGPAASTATAPSNTPQCDMLPTSDWDGDTGTLAAVEVPAIPYPSGEQKQSVAMLWIPLIDGPTDRPTADGRALTARAEASTAATRDQRWLVIESDRRFHAYQAELYRPIIGTEINEIRWCLLSESRGRVVSAYATYSNPFSEVYLHADWTAERGTTIRNPSTGEIILAGPGPDIGPIPTAAGVPFSAGPAADSWLLANVTNRSLGVRCENARPAASYGPAAIAAVGCQASDDWTGMGFVLYESSSALDAYFDERVDQLWSFADHSRCNAIWTLGDDVARSRGRVQCLQYTDPPAAVIEWTESAWRVAASVWHVPGNLDDLLQAWSRRGLARVP